MQKLNSWQAAVVIAVFGFAVYFTGLTSPFRGDDNSQIVDNPVVHSISHIRLLFEGGTFYIGNGIAPLYGVYYRPLMMMTFSVLYTLFGAQAFYFHLLQLLLCIGSAILLYLFFRYSFTPMMALGLAVIFLVHPINSQVVYALPSMQDALFFFFGILSLWLLVRFHSARSLWLVAASLFVALLAKETAVLFAILAIIYLRWLDRQRLLRFICIVAIPLTAYLILRVHAIGLLGHNPHNAPIDNIPLLGRLLTAPSIFAFGIVRLLFPLQLAIAYYWVYPVFSIRHVLLPLIFDSAVMALIVLASVQARKRLPKSDYYTFLFFTIWFLLGMAIHLQILPLDMTVSEPWFYFSVAGFLGMLGGVLRTFRGRLNRQWLFDAAVLVILILGARSSLRGLDWRNPITLETKDITVSKEDFAVYNALAARLMSQGKYGEAKVYVDKSIKIYPRPDNYLNLGEIRVHQGDYAGAMAAYNDSLRYGSYFASYDSIGALMLGYGNRTTNIQFLQSAVQKFPRDPQLWYYLAILEYWNGDIPRAQSAIDQARALDTSSRQIMFVFQKISNRLPL